MLSPQALVKVLASRLLPQKAVDGPESERALRGDGYGGIWTQAPPPGAYGYGDEGSYMLASSSGGIGSGQTWVAAQTAFSDTTPNFYIYNGENPNNPVAKTIWLHFLKMIATAAPTAATAIHYAWVLDTVARALTTDNTANVTPVNPTGSAGTIIAWNPGGGSILKVQNSATASVIAGSSQNKRVVARGCLGGLAIAGDELQINFGALDAGAQPATTAAEGAGQPGRRVSCEGPVAIPPGYSLTGHIWMPSSSASFNPEWVMGLWAR